MLTEFRADLHIHTCLSPCGDLSMSPAAIVKEAEGKGIDIIAICDHNSSENAGAVIETSGGTGVTVLPGVEVTTKEEVHLCALFKHINEALQLQTWIHDHLEGENDETVFGLQVVMNAEGKVLKSETKRLIGATSLSIDEIVNAVHSRRGLAIAAHIDREGFGIIGQLGFIPPGLRLDALEISPGIRYEQARVRFREYADFPFLRSSDAHYLDDIGKGMTTFLLEEPSFDEIRMALRGEEGRGLITPIDH